jgi:hypothetical protein
MISIASMNCNPGRYSFVAIRVGVLRSALPTNMEVAARSRCAASGWIGWFLRNALVSLLGSRLLYLVGAVFPSR